jgi:succinoglycan biosynthesis protein ExoA
MNTVPFVSVILPIRNEAEFIESSLGAVLRQDYPPDRMEILVVDGMSIDGTQEIVQGIIDELQNGNENDPPSDPSLQTRVKLLNNPRLIVPSSLNKAIAQARGTIIVRVDGHAIIATDYVSQSVMALHRTGADVVGGLMTPVGKGFIGETISLAHNLRFGLGGGLFHRAASETEADTVYMGTFRRDLFDRVGLFDERLERNQDIELNARVWLDGGRVVLSPVIRSKYFCSNSVRSVWRKNYANGLWLFPTVAATPQSLSIRHFVPILFVVGLLSSLIAALAVPFGWVFLLVVAGSYAVALVIAATLAAARNGWRFLVSLPVVFVTLHISYGLGSLVGLARFLVRRIRRNHHEEEIDGHI